MNVLSGNYKSLTFGFSVLSLAHATLSAIWAQWLDVSNHNAAWDWFTSLLTFLWTQAFTFVTFYQRTKYFLSQLLVLQPAEFHGHPRLSFTSHCLCSKRMWLYLPVPYTQIFPFTSQPRGRSLVVWMQMIVQVHQSFKKSSPQSPHVVYGIFTFRTFVAPYDPIWSSAQSAVHTFQIAVIWLAAVLLDTWRVEAPVRQSVGELWPAVLNHSCFSFGCLACLDVFSSLLVVQLPVVCCVQFVNIMYSCIHLKYFTLYFYSSFINTMYASHTSYRLSKSTDEFDWECVLIFNSYFFTIAASNTVALGKVQCQTFH